MKMFRCPSCHKVFYPITLACIPTKYEISCHCGFSLPNYEGENLPTQEEINSYYKRRFNSCKDCFRVPCTIETCGLCYEDEEGFQSWSSFF